MKCRMCDVLINQGEVDLAETIVGPGYETLCAACAESLAAVTVAGPPACTVASVEMVVARDSLGDLDVTEFCDRLEAAIRDWPDVTEDTEIDVSPGDCTRRSGTYTGSEPHLYDTLIDRIDRAAETVFAEMCVSRVE
jgi:hypothetical protein